ncbi:unnamed protein product [Amoebophrya sp. A120]|nr:unnamed protein product [Amoebophrya sp. A120]|eukprot:GSA120T00019575001.1
MTHQGMEYCPLKGSVPPIRPGAKLLGNDPYYLVSPTSFAVGTVKQDAVKWRNVAFDGGEPPARVSFVPFLVHIDNRPFVFVFGGQLVEEVVPTLKDDNDGGEFGGLQRGKKKKEEPPKLRFTPSTKMYCCDVEQRAWRSVRMKDPTPAPRAFATAAVMERSQCAVIAFGQGLPENLKLADSWVFDYSKATISFPDIENCFWRKIYTEQHAYDEPQPGPRLQPASMFLPTPKGDAEEMLIFGGQVGDVGANSDAVCDDMWKLDIKQEKWVPVKYAGYYPGARRDAYFVQASPTEVLFVGGSAELLAPNASSDVVGNISSPPPSPKSGTVAGNQSTQFSSNLGAAVAIDQCLETLVFDTELAIFTRPAIGFLPKNVPGKALFLGNKLPCLFMSKKTKHGYIQYPAPKKPPPKREEPTEELTRNDAERMLFRTRKEMDELENELQAVCKERLDLRAQIEELQADEQQEGKMEANEAYKQIEELRQKLQKEEDLETEILHWIKEETTWRRNFSYLNRQLKNLIATAEAKYFSEQLLETAVENGLDSLPSPQEPQSKLAKKKSMSAEHLAENKMNDFEKDTEVAYKTHAEQIQMLRELLKTCPEYRELLQLSKIRAQQKKTRKSVIDKQMPPEFLAQISGAGGGNASSAASRKNSSASGGGAGSVSSRKNSTGSAG